MAVRSENYRTADHAQAERCIHHVGRIALRAFAYYGTPLEVSTSKQSGFPADSENDRRVAGRDHSCPYLCRPGSVFTFSLPAGRDAYAKSPRRSMHSELKRSRKKGEQDNGGDIRLHSERTKVTSARVNLVQPQSQHWRIEMKYNRLGNSGLFVSLIQRISRVSPAAGGTGRTSYICLAPINPINGFWLYRFIKLKTGEGGCDPYSDGRHAVQHRRDWSGYVTVRIGIKVRKRLNIVIAPSPSVLVKHIYRLASFRRDHFCFNVEDFLNRLRTENIFSRPFGDEKPSLKKDESCDVPRHKIEVVCRNDNSVSFERQRLAQLQYVQRMVDIEVCRRLV